MDDKVSLLMVCLSVPSGINGYQQSVEKPFKIKTGADSLPMRSSSTLYLTTRLGSGNAGLWPFEKCNQFFNISCL